MVAASAGRTTSRISLELSAAASAAVALRLRGHHAARGRRGQAQADAGALLALPSRLYYRQRISAPKARKRGSSGAKPRATSRCMAAGWWCRRGGRSRTWRPDRDGGACRGCCAARAVPASQRRFACAGRLVLQGIVASGGAHAAVAQQRVNTRRAATEGGEGFRRRTRTAHGQHFAAEARAGLRVQRAWRRAGRLAGGGSLEGSGVGRQHLGPLVVERRHSRRRTGARRHAAAGARRAGTAPRLPGTSCSRASTWAMEMPWARSCISMSNSANSIWRTVCMPLW